MRVLLFLAGLLFLAPCAHAQLSLCTLRQFTTATSGATTVAALTPVKTTHASIRICLTHAVVQWGSTAGNFYFFSSAKADCSTMGSRLSTTYYGVANSVQEVRDAAPLSSILQVDAAQYICLYLSQPPTSVNTEVFYAP